ncbi:MAG TPA: T9SS type A sorting domain-containing protein [Brumimicrobium sp.]|nr:T9SS type A sorting domain-containing protein [Brumimicrobium sp.]
MKQHFHFGWITKNKTVTSGLIAPPFLNALVSLIFFTGLFSSTAFAQQETVVLTTGTSWTIPADANLSSIVIECWGAGGGGAYTSSADDAGGAGGGGAYAKKDFTSFTFGQTINYEIGIGGSGGTGTNAGGNTWFFDNTASGVSAAGGKGAANNSSTGGAGGLASASIGDVTFSGGKGGNGSFTSGWACGDEQASGGGGAAATSTAIGANGGNGSTSTGGFLCSGNHSTAGTGGSNLLFTGYTSSGGIGKVKSSSNSLPDSPPYTGNSGSNGAGGSGAVSNTYNGGHGGSGLIRITYDKICTTDGIDVQVACGSFTWTNGIEYTASNNTATDTIFNGNAAGCDSIITLNLTINNADITTTQTGGINLSANATGATYQWIDCDNGNAPITGETNQTFTASINGNYAVIITENGCTDTSACMVVNNVGLKDFNTITGINIFPNPTKGLVTINLESTQDGQQTLELIDATGRLLSKQLLMNNSTTLDLTNYVRGMYLVRITNGDNQSVHRIIKE